MLVLCLSLLFYEMHAEPDGPADIDNYTHTHTHTRHDTTRHDTRIIRVTSPLSRSPQSCCFPRGFPTNLLSRPHIPCLLRAEPVLDLSILIIDHLNKPLELPIKSYPRC